jgi:Fe-S-cluster containining protein
MATRQEHNLDEDGYHDPNECYSCLLEKPVANECRCSECCRRLLIEVVLPDAEREPRIALLGSPIYTDERLTESGKRELEGYFLNAPDGPCVFLDRQTKLCTIHETRPLVCRLFDCEGEGREQLIELGIVDRNPENSTREPDYEGFCKHLDEWDRNNVCYSIKDMAELAEKYHCPVPDSNRDRFGHPSSGGTA